MLLCQPLHQRLVSLGKKTAFTQRAQSDGVLSEIKNVKIWCSFWHLTAASGRLCSNRQIATASIRSPAFIVELAISNYLLSLKLHLFTLKYKFHINMNSLYV